MCVLYSYKNLHLCVIELLFLMFCLYNKNYFMMLCDKVHNIYVAMCNVISNLVFRIHNVTQRRISDWNALLFPGNIFLFHYLPLFSPFSFISVWGCPILRWTGTSGKTHWFLLFLNPENMQVCVGVVPALFWSKQECKILHTCYWLVTSKTFTTQHSQGDIWSTLP